MERFGRAILLAAALSISSPPQESSATIVDPYSLENPPDIGLDFYRQMSLATALAISAMLSDIVLTDEEARRNICNINTPHIDPRAPERYPRPHPFMDDRALELMIRRNTREKCQEMLRFTGGEGWILLRNE